MDYVKPGEALQSMIDAGKTSAELTVSQQVKRGVLGGAKLASATTLAYKAEAETKIPAIGALIFPVERSL